jgi:hypothetical protein
MASTYSTTLRLELIGNGDQSGTWGDTTNSNLGDLIEAAITNVVDITFANATYTLSANNGLPDEARNAVLNLIGTNSTAQNLIAPAVEKTYIVKNATGAAVTIKTSGGTGVAVATGTTRIVWCDGTNFYTAASQTVIATTAPINNSVSGDTVTISMDNSGVNAGSYTISNITVDAKGRVTAASSTTLGTMSTQNANAVAITGGNAVLTNVTATTVALGGGWTVTESSGTLVFRSSGTSRMRLDASGNLTLTGNVTAYGTI